MTEKILLLRETFNELPADLQFKEARRFIRLVNNIKPILVSPKNFPDEQLTFHRVEEVVKYFFNLGHTRAANANVYKALRGERATAYGHRIWYGED